MHMKKRIQEIFKSLIKDAESGKITLATKDGIDWNYNVKFYYDIQGTTNVQDNDVPILQIPNFSRAMEVLEKYIKVMHKDYMYAMVEENFTEDGFDKYLMLTALINCTNYDFENFIPYLEKRIQMVENKQTPITFELGKVYGYDLVAQITQTTPNLEAPSKFTPIFLDENGERYVLPSIVYGYYDDKVYVGAVQGEKGNQKDQEIGRRLDRFFRKVNKGVDMQDIEGQVSPSALVSMTMFLEYMKSQGKIKVVAPCFMPIRARTTMENIEARFNSGYEPYDKDWKDAEIQKKERDQFNITNRLMYLFRRYNWHFDDSECYFDDIEESMKIWLKPQQTKTDNIIFNIQKAAEYKFGQLKINEKE